MFYTYGKATEISPDKTLIQRTKKKVTHQVNPLYLLVLSVLPILYAPLVGLLIWRPHLPQLLLVLMSISIFYNALIALIWISRIEIYRFIKEGCKCST